MTMEAEYSLPQHSAANDIICQDDKRKYPPEAYASSAIYSELNNYQVSYLRTYLERTTFLLKAKTGFKEN